MRRRTKVLLAVSLGLNMLVIGAVGGMIFHGGPRGSASGYKDAAYGPYTRALSHLDRRQIGQAMRDEIGGFRQNLSQIRAGFIAIKDALRADTYDRDLVHQLIKDQEAFGSKRHQVGQRLLLERLDAMSQAERHQFAERLGHERRR
ncbi:hypothetical protein JI58_05900 [Marinosulfonomonas sp. PRT-SC04]|nr:hypothetical protein JI58_05900 [Marinosulfonomonas sp. PRT-SC04]